MLSTQTSDRLALRLEIIARMIPKLGHDIDTPKSNKPTNKKQPTSNKHDSKYVKI